jgi:hypothetical protein
VSESPWRAIEALWWREGEFWRRVLKEEGRAAASGGTESKRRGVMGVVGVVGRLDGKEG